MCTKSISWKTFTNLPGRLTYTATSTRPDLAYVSAKLSQVTENKLTRSDTKILNQAIRDVKRVNVGLTFPRLNLDSTHIRG